MIAVSHPYEMTMIINEYYLRLPYWRFAPFILTYIILQRRSYFVTRVLKKKIKQSSMVVSLLSHLPRYTNN